MRFTSLIVIVGLSVGIAAAPRLAHAADVYYTTTFAPPPIAEILARRTSYAQRRRCQGSHSRQARISGKYRPTRTRSGPSLRASWAYRCSCGR
jgi:uncharacterized protein (DUF2236 family)